MVRLLSVSLTAAGRCMASTSLVAVMNSSREQTQYDFHGMVTGLSSATLASISWARRQRR